MVVRKPKRQLAKPVTYDEVAKHNRPGDIWLVIRDKVYDVDGWLEDHPGGTRILLENGGTDATEVWEGLPHSDDAKEIRKDFYIGELLRRPGDPVPKDQEPLPVYDPNANKGGLPWLWILVFLLGLVGAGGFYFAGGAALLQ
ncbi:MAG: hypothetical protein M1819_003628 [Sarea resinae]|nr:MAG: hypothetical protein M1819_003628 [Sarea resinae]